MKPYIYTAREGVHVIDLVLTKEKLDQAVEYILNVVQEGKPILFVGTKRQASQVIKEQAQRAGAFYSCERWIGGLLTNFNNIRKTIARLEELDGILTDKKQLENLSTRDRFVSLKEHERLEKIAGGLRGLETLPGAMYLVDPRREQSAIREAQIKGIPTIALTDTNSDPTLIDYPIPGNDDGLRSIELITQTIADAIIAAKT